MDATELHKISDKAVNKAYRTAKIYVHHLMELCKDEAKNGKTEAYPLLFKRITGPIPQAYSGYNFYSEHWKLSTSNVNDALGKAIIELLAEKGINVIKRQGKRSTFVMLTW